MKANIGSSWSSYRAAVVPASAGPTHVKECRRAFYAGAQAVLLLQMQISGADVPDDVGAQYIESLHRELATFAQLIQAGQA